MTLGQTCAVVAQVVMVVLAGPLLVGLIRRVRARLEGRVGAPIHQPLLDLRKQLAKERIAPDHSSWVFVASPVVLVSTSVLVAAIAPFLTTRSPFDGVGDVFVVVALLLAGTVFLALGGLDPGTAFGGMGASREMTITALAEPTLLLAILAVSVPAGSSNLGAIVDHTLERPEVLVSVQYVLAAVALGIAALAETSRLPVDNPSTHLELTMIHEAMVLEHAGPDLALVEVGSAMRLVIFLGLLANLFLPWGVATGTGAGALTLSIVTFAVKLAILGTSLSVFEVFVAKLRLFRVPELLGLSFVLAFLAIASAAVLR